MTGARQREGEAVRDFVLRACLMSELLRKFPGVRELLEGLRYQVDIKKSAQLGNLPLVTVAAPFRTMRPDDSVVAMAAGLAGGTSFSEVLDVERVQNMADPLRVEMIALLEKHKIQL